jgi:DNA-binding MarR family transcriptional regulator
MTASVSSLRVANQMGALTRYLADHQDAALDAELGLSGEAAAAVVAIDAFPGERVAFFAPILGLTSAGIVRLVARLEARGLVGRQPGPDGRSHALRLTDHGASALSRIHAARRAVLDGALSPLDEDDVRQLERLLDRVLRQLPADRTAARRMCRLCDHDICDAANLCPVDNALTAAGHADWTPPSQATT